MHAGRAGLKMGFCEESCKGLRIFAEMSPLFHFAKAVVDGVYLENTLKRQGS